MPGYSNGQSGVITCVRFTTILIGNSLTGFVPCAQRWCTSPHLLSYSYLENVMNYSDMPPLKNMLEAVCKLICQHQIGAHIYVSDMLPRVSSSPLRRPSVKDANYTLLQAVRSTHQGTGRKGIFPVSTCSFY